VNLHEPGQSCSAEWLKRGTLRYTAEGREIVGRNGTYFNNRPLHCEQQSEAAVFVGDRPLVRLVTRTYCLGALSVAVKDRWLHEQDEVESRYRCGRMTWRSAGWSLEAVPLKKVAGFAVRLRVTGISAGEKLIWAFGGAKPVEDPLLEWDPIMRGNPDICRSGDPRKPLLSFGVMPEWCRGNVASGAGQEFRLLPARDAKQAAIGRVSRTGVIVTTDQICGTIELQAGEDEVFWVVGTEPPARDPATAFAEAVAYLESIERVQVSTPDPRLDAAVAAVCHAIDASCERDPFIFKHGCSRMAYNVRFIGWRVIGGATALGWHDRVKGNAAYYISRQKKEDPTRTQPCPNVERLCCHESAESRFHGKGSIARDEFTMYDVQSQFFDQTIREWRWTGDKELEALLRPALELHLEWMRECFDPDDDGLYESYINTLPTDSVWYNGGGSAEASSYAYFAHLAAREMALDAATATRHQAQADKIQRAMREILWIKDRGHFGLYVEQGGHHRVHADAWSLSQFLPIDAGLTTPEEAAQALAYTEWGLERIRLPFGGVLCQPSNWVPWKWSVRDVFGGDLFHLALAYFQTGLGDGGWELLLGGMLETAYAGAVPGGFSHIGAGTDFADNSHMFARAVVEGLFGFAPDYPKGRVVIRPAFPLDWPAASIRTPDFTLEYRRGEYYRVTLAKPAEVEFRVPGQTVVFPKANSAELKVSACLTPVRLVRERCDVSVPAPLTPKKNAAWNCLDLSAHYNGDVRTIFQQQYLSPRPKTCSVRLGVDGYSAWTFPYWGLKPPVITVNYEPIITPQGVPFRQFASAQNIAFTSLWDNWPTVVSAPVNEAADAIWLLVCGSTFPMQTRSANAEVRFRYADGVEEKLAVVPPLNFWMLCPWGGEDYSYEHDAFCLPAQPPPQVQLGNNCRAMVLSSKLRSGIKLTDVTLETLSQDVVIGLMGISLESATK